MKKLLLSLILVGGIWLKNGNSQDIPDPNFRQAISNECSICINLSTGDLTPEAQNLIELNVSGMNISSITGIEGFTSLKVFYCNNNIITTIAILPDSLQVLWCNDNLITSLPAILPGKLEDFKCDNNQLASLPPLPNSIKSLKCSDNLLTALPVLPNNLDNLTCNDNYIFSLPPLPSNLTSLHCNLNFLTQLPELPGSFKKLFCEQNDIVSLPALPASLTTLEISGNPISCLPELPFNLEVFGYELTNISCLPNLPDIYQDLSPFPLCINGQGNSCALNPEISGTVFVDYNGDGFQDVNDIGFPGITVKANTGNWVGFTNPSGSYSTHAGFSGTYSYSVTPPAGNYSVLPSSPYSFTFDDTSGQEVKNVNFGIHPAPDVYDLGITLTAAPFVSGSKTTYYVTYTNKGPYTISGSVVFEYDHQKIIYLGADISPFVETDSTLTWVFTALLPFKSQTVATKFETPSTVLTGTQIGFRATGLINAATDIYPVDNVQIDTVSVVSSGNVNYKSVNTTIITPPELATGNEEIEYIIYFQNTGTVNSQNLDIYDTLSASLDNASFEVLATSHEGMLEVKNAVQYDTHPLILHWNFDGIKLSYVSNDPLGSRGFVKFKVKPLTSSMPGTKILNNGIIQFSNTLTPIVTNTVTTNIMFPVYVSDPEHGVLQLEVSPNPFETTINVRYVLTQPEEVTISLYNTMGTMIWERSFSAGSDGNVSINLDRVASGPYLLHIRGSHTSAIAKILKR